MRQLLFADFTSSVLYRGISRYHFVRAFIEGYVSWSGHNLLTAVTTHKVVVMFADSLLTDLELGLLIYSGRYHFVRSFIRCYVAWSGHDKIVMISNL